MPTKLLCLLVVAVTSLAIGCGPGEVGPTAYEYAKALYSVTNRQASERLELVRGQMETAHAAGELSASEMKLLQGIVDDAARGDWKQANRDCRSVMEAQVK